MPSSFSCVRTAKTTYAARTSDGQTLFFSSRRKIMYRSDSAAAEAKNAAMGYEVEDWANNNLGVARGFWSKDYVAPEVEAFEARCALKKEIRRRTKRASAASAELKSLTGALRRAERAEKADRLLEVLGTLERKVLSAETVLGSGILPKVQFFFLKRAFFRSSLASRAPRKTMPSGAAPRSSTSDGKASCRAAGSSRTRPKRPSRRNTKSNDERPRPTTATSWTRARRWVVESESRRSLLIIVVCSSRVDLRTWQLFPLLLVDNIRGS